MFHGAFIGRPAGRTGEPRSVPRPPVAVASIMEHVELWLKFGLAAGLVVAAGMLLTRYAEQLAAALGWGHAFAGFVILGWATSLPELTISISAVVAEESAGLSSGNIIGSCLFNLAILAILDLMVLRGRADGDEPTRGLVPLALFNVAMLLATLAVALAPASNAGSWAPLYGILLIGLYLVATLQSYRAESGKQGGPDALGDPWVPGRRCLLAGGVILATGIWLTSLGDDLAQTYDLGEGLVGTVFLATVSSLPELVTGVAAVRAGLHTLAAGSILGSNIFNMGIFGICDLLYVGGPGEGSGILAAVSTTEPARLFVNTSAALALTLLALWAAKQSGTAGHRATPALPLVTLVIYVVALGAGS